MGCEFNFQKLVAKTDAAAKKEAASLIEQAAYDHGHGGYTGSFAECRGAMMTPQTFPSYAEAEDWLDENAEKWGALLIVRVGKEGSYGYCVGANCSS